MHISKTKTAKLTKHSGFNMLNKNLTDHYFLLFLLLLFFPADLFILNDLWDLNVPILDSFIPVTLQHKEQHKH